MNYITNQNIEKTLEENYVPYIYESVLNRALPNVIDGFKPSHRKLLYTMYKMGLLNKKVKSANITGQTLRLNPHGDGAVYETMVRMVDTNESLLLPYIKGKGSFGKVYSDGAYAHQRYTEAGLAEIANELFKEIDKNGIDFVDNYDNTMKEPTLLPVTFPNVLCNATKGIAVGMASNICSFNLVDVCNATIEYLEKDCTDNIELIPDFSTYGYYLYDKNELQKINTTGKGSIKLRCNYEYDKKNNCIEITQIPYTTSVEQIIDKICDLIKAKKLTEITDVRDETDLKGLKLAIDVKRNVDVENLMNKLYKMTTLEDTFSCNFNVLYEPEQGLIKPKVMGVHEIIKEWSKWRISCIRRELIHNVDVFSKELHKLYGLKAITQDLDKSIHIIRTSKTDDIAIDGIMSNFKLDKEQAEYVANMKLRNLNEDYILKQLDEVKSLENKLKNLKETIDNESKIKEVIIKQLHNIIKKYGIERKTVILKDYKKSTVSTSKQVDDYSCFVTVTKDGYVKKMLRTTDISNVKIKDGDTIINSWTTSNTSTLLVFTDLCNCYKILLDDLDTSTPSTLGSFLPAHLGLKNENIVSIQLADKGYNGYLLNVYEDNLMAKIPVKSFETKNKQSRLKNALSDSRLINQIFITEDIDIICVSTIDKVLVTNTSQFSPKSSKNSNGMALMKSKDDSTIKYAFPVSDISRYNIEDLEYYRGKRGATGNYLKKTDTII